MGRPSMTIITDQDSSMKEALQLVYPQHFTGFENGILQTKWGTKLVMHREIVWRWMSSFRLQMSRNIFLNLINGGVHGLKQIIYMEIDGWQTCLKSDIVGARFS